MHTDRHAPDHAYPVRMLIVQLEAMHPQKKQEIKTDKPANPRKKMFGTRVREEIRTRPFAPTTL